MNAHDENGVKHLLRQALPPVEGDSAPERDLWPAMLRRMDAEPAVPAFSGWAVFDGALLAGLVGLAAFFPAAIPVFLYYL
jgi:anti-sigma factor RsiW